MDVHFHTRQDTAILWSMDEIIIEEKKYVSSKQAAKLTGYAKDYVGQLCREGRVPARLVGRSWYVLESAIQDHRFGGQEDIAKDARIETAKAPSVKSAWEFPRYEATMSDMLPTVDRTVEVEVAAATFLDTKEELKIADRPEEDIQASWKAWFDQVAEAVKPEVVAIEEKKEQIVHEPMSIPGLVTEVPLSRSYDQELPARITPTRREPAVVFESRKEKPKRSGVVTQGLYVLLVLFTGCVAAAAILNTGSFDKYITSFGGAALIAGISVTNK